MSGNLDYYAEVRYSLPDTMCIITPGPDVNIPLTKKIGYCYSFQIKQNAAGIESENSFSTKIHPFHKITEGGMTCS